MNGPATPPSDGCTPSATFKDCKRPSALTDSSHQLECMERLFPDQDTLLIPGVVAAA